MNLIEKIAQMKVPTSSHIAAVQNFNERARDGEFGAMSTVWANLTNNVVPAMAEPFTRTQVAYLIQEAVRCYVLVLPLELEAAAKLATRQAQEYVAANPWVYAADQPEEQKVDVEGNVIPQRKRGAKQELAAQVFERMKGKDKKEIIEAFVSEVGLTPAGAQTYFYNLKKLEA